MKAAFTCGAKVRFKLAEDALGAECTLCAPDHDSVYISPGKRAADGIQPHYIGEGFYCVLTFTGLKLIAHEDDLVLADDYTLEFSNH